MPNVLLVDDNVTFARFMRVLLESKLPGVEVRTADCAAAARRMCESDDPDLAILDYRLPDASGLSLYDELVQSRPGLPFIMMSAEPIGPSRLAGRRNVVGVLVKPFSSEGVVRLVRSVLPAQAHGREKAAYAGPRARADSAPAIELKEQLVRLLTGLHEVRSSLKSGSLRECDVHEVVDKQVAPLIDAVSELSRTVSGRGGSKP